jgi:RecA-family ATPase
MQPRDTPHNAAYGFPVESGKKPPAWKPANPAYASPKIQGVIDPVALQDKPIPDRRWIVPNWVPVGQVTMISGDGGTGKTLLGQQLATACATDRPWLGMPVTRCKALCVFCEDDGGELHRRQDSINEAYGIDFADLEHLQWVTRPGDNNALVAFESFEAVGEPTEFFQQVHDWMMDFGAQLLILDSLHDLFPGNENNRVHARRFISLLSHFARDTDGAVVITAHPSLSGRASGTGEAGSTAWNNAVRSRLYLRRPQGDDGSAGDDDERILRRMKANYASARDQLDLTWDSGVLKVKEAPGGIERRLRNTQIDRLVFDRAETWWGADQPLSATPSQGARYLPRALATESKFKIDELRSAMDLHLKAGNLKIDSRTARTPRGLRVIRRPPHIDHNPG